MRIRLKAGLNLRLSFKILLLSFSLWLVGKIQKKWEIIQFVRFFRCFWNFLRKNWFFLHPRKLIRRKLAYCELLKILSIRKRASFNASVDKFRQVLMDSLLSKISRSHIDDLLSIQVNYLWSIRVAPATNGF